MEHKILIAKEEEKKKEDVHELELRNDGYKTTLYCKTHNKFLIFFGKFQAEIVNDNCLFENDGHK